MVYSETEEAKKLLLSLFSGCGGLDLGFERAGFTVGLAYDIRPYSIASWNRNRPLASSGHVADLSGILLKDMDRNYGSRFMPSGVIGGPPCQSFSRANRSRKETDLRQKLVRQFFNIALRFHRHRQPLEFILMENVPEFTKAEKGKLLEQEIKRLRAHDFHVHTFIIDAAAYSVPQRRKRFFLLAVPNNCSKDKRWALPDGKGEGKTVRDVIYELPPPTFFHRGIQPDAIRHHPNHWCMNPKSRKFFDGSLTPGRSSGRCFKTLAWDSLSFTVAYGHREVHVHPNGNRRLSVLEAMRLQGFPDTYILEGTLSAQIDQVSEAVPPPLAEAVARSIWTMLNQSYEKKADSILRYSSSSLSTESG